MQVKSYDQNDSNNYQFSMIFLFLSSLFFMDIFLFSSSDENDVSYKCLASCLNCALARLMGLIPSVLRRILQA